MPFFIAAISLGFLGSFHCIGMCGPIALALPVNQYSPLKKYSGILLYNVGRIITYTTLGLFFGLLGQSFFIGGLQQGVSSGIGVLLLASVILPNVSFINGENFSFLYRLINVLKNKLGNLFNKKGIHFLFFIGLLNGLLPCGLVYLGIAGAVATGHYLKGAEFMFYFGVGTSPMMFAASMLGQFVSARLRNTIHKTIPVMVTLMALMLIVRGMNLGIPYLSPAFEKTGHKISCCEKPEVTKEKIHCEPTKCH
ncbi:MAG: sulfite exporter TauE/SafE family protein [Bacteroidota bacterium]